MKFQENNYSSSSFQQLQQNSDLEQYSEEKQFYLYHKRNDTYELDQQSLLNINQKDYDLQDRQNQKEHFLAQTQSTYFKQRYLSGSLSQLRSQTNNKQIQQFKQQEIQRNARQDSQQMQFKIISTKKCILQWICLGSILILTINLFNFSNSLGFAIIFLLFISTQWLQSLKPFNNNIKNLIRSFENVQCKYQNLVKVLKVSYWQNIQFVIQMNNQINQILSEYFQGLLNVQYINDQFQKSKLINQIFAKNQNFHIILSLNKNVLFLKQAKQLSLNFLSRFQEEDKEQNLIQIIQNQIFTNGIKRQNVSKKIQKKNQILSFKLDLLLHANNLLTDKKRDCDKLCPLLKDQYLIKLHSKRDQSVYLQSLIHFNILIQHFESSRNIFFTRHRKSVAESQLNMKHQKRDQTLQQPNGFQKVLQYLQEEVNIKKFNAIFQCDSYKRRNKYQTTKQCNKIQERSFSLKSEFFDQKKLYPAISQWLTMDDEQVTYQKLNCKIDKIYLNQILEKKNKRKEQTQKSYNQNSQHRYKIEKLARTDQIYDTQQQQSNLFFFDKDQVFSFNLNTEISSQIKFLNQAKIVQDYQSYYLD